MLMECAEVSQGVGSNWVMWQFKDPGPPSQWGIVWPRKNSLIKNGKRSENNIGYSFAF